MAGIREEENRECVMMIDMRDNFSPSRWRFGDDEVVIILINQSSMNRIRQHRNSSLSMSVPVIIKARCNSYTYYRKTRGIPKRNNNDEQWSTYFSILLLHHDNNQPPIKSIRPKCTTIETAFQLFKSLQICELNSLLQ